MISIRKSNAAQQKEEHKWKVYKSASAFEKLICYVVMAESRKRGNRRHQRVKEGLDEHVEHTHIRKSQQEDAEWGKGERSTSASLKKRWRNTEY